MNDKYTEGEKVGKTIKVVKANPNDIDLSNLYKDVFFKDKKVTGPLNVTREKK